MSERWYEAIPDVSLQLECDGATHRVRWSRGRLALDDHDVGAERALGALGGERPLCIELFDVWSQATADPGILVHVLRRDPGAPVQDLAHLARHLRAVQSSVAALRQTHAGGTSGSVVSMAEGWRSELLGNLPPAFRAPLVASLVRTIERRWTDESIASSGVADEIALLVDRSMRRSLWSWTPPGGHVRIGMQSETHVMPGGAPWALNAESFGDTILARVNVPLRWVSEVWARGIALVDGCFVIDVAEARNHGRGLRVDAVRWERGAARAFGPVVAPAIVVQVAPGEWSLHWRSV